MKILIIEDEPLAAEDLKETLLEIDPQIEILAVLPSIAKSIQFLQHSSRQPQLIFSDIQLQDGLSFELFKTVALTTPVIFCTAYNEYALQAFRNNGIDYILKPFSQDSIRQALQKYQNLKSTLSVGIDHYERLIDLLQRRDNSPKTTAVLVHHKDKIIPISTDSIAVFYIQHEIVHLQTFAQEHYTVSQHMEELERRVGDAFFRINRQFLVNRKAIANASQHFARKLAVHLTIPFVEEIILSKVRVPLFLEWLER